MNRDEIWKRYVYIPERDLCVNKDIGAPEKILLTGSTGFIGKYLLTDLLEHSKIMIYVLLRDVVDKDGFTRLRDELIKFNLWRDEYVDRLIVIKGDLEKEHFGLSAKQWYELCNKIDIIIHAAALVNFMLPFSSLFASNVGSVVELIKLCTQGKTKKLVYLSDCNIFGMGSVIQEKIYETTRADCTMAKIDYIKTRWLAEELVSAAGERGVPVTIFRLPHVGGDMRTGRFQPRDFFWLRLKACILQKSAPDIEEPYYIIPVDFLVHAITEIVLNNKTGLGCLMAVSDEKLTWNDIFNTFIDMGYELKRESPDIWIKHTVSFIRSSEKSSNLMYVMPFLMMGKTSFNCPKFDNSLFQKELKKLNITLPRFSEMAKRYVEYASENQYF